MVDDEMPFRALIPGITPELSRISLLLALHLTLPLGVD
jgi:hypothetical protein